MITINWQEWKKAVIDLFFPGDCPICERAAYLEDISFSCLSCLDQVAWIQKSRCKFCGVGMDGMDYAGLTCRNCREFPPLFSAGRSMFHLNKAGQSLVHELKYDRNKNYSRTCLYFWNGYPIFRLYNGCSAHTSTFAPKKIYQRGHNQSLWIAEAFAKKPV